MGSAFSKEKTPQRENSLCFQPSSHHIPPRMYFWYFWDPGDSILQGGGCEEPNSAPKHPKITKRCSGDAETSSTLVVRYHSWVMELGKERLGFMDGIDLTPGNPHNPLQVPTEGAQHPKVPPALSPGGYFGPLRMELGQE